MRSGLTSVIFVSFGLVLFFSAYNVVQNARIERKGGRTVNVEPDEMAEALEPPKGQYEDRSLAPDDRLRRDPGPGRFHA